MEARSLRVWGPTASMMIVSVISYVDRNTLALLSPTILGELGLTAEQYGWMVTLFSIAYTLGNPTWGWVIDRVGVRVGMLIAVSVWSVASASHALAGSFVGFSIARAALGFGEGATFPGGLRTVTQTLPPELRARGVAIAYSGGSLGAILTPLIVTPIALAYGWRAAFLCTGLFGAAWLASWLVQSRSEAIRDVPVTEHVAAQRVRLREPRIFAFIGAYALGGLPLGFVMYGAPLYLYGALGQTQSDLGKLLWLPPLGWEVGYFFWGWLTDKLTRGVDDPSMTFRKLLTALVVLTLPLCMTPSMPGIAAPLAAFSLATFTAGGFIIVGISYAGRVFSSRDAGLLAGIGAGSWSAGVAALMPFFGRLFDRHAYPTAFALATAVPLVGYAVFSVVDRVAPRAPST